MRPKVLPAFLAIVMLSACTGGSTPAPRSAGSVKLPPLSGGGTPRGQVSPPGDPVIGRSAAALVALFGPARLDITEGPGRKLQFSGAGCVLDIYLYAPRERAEAVATHVDARSTDGRDADRAACIRALRQKP